MDVGAGWEPAPDVVNEPQNELTFAIWLNNINLGYNSRWNCIWFEEFVLEPYLIEGTVDGKYFCLNLKNLCHNKVIIQTNLHRL